MSWIVPYNHKKTQNCNFAVTIKFLAQNLIGWQISETTHLLFVSFSDISVWDDVFHPKIDLALTHLQAARPICISCANRLPDDIFPRKLLHASDATSRKQSTKKEITLLLYAGRKSWDITKWINISIMAVCNVKRTMEKWMGEDLTDHVKDKPQSGRTSAIMTWHWRGLQGQLAYISIRFNVNKSTLYGTLDSEINRGLGRSSAKQRSGRVPSSPALTALTSFPLLRPMHSLC